MNMMRTMIVALFAVVVASCATLQGGRSEVEGTLTRTEADVVTRTQYLPGKVVVQPYPIPDSSLTPDPEPLTEDYITGEDIEPEAALETAVAWSRQYHDLATTYDVLRGWIIGVRAGQDALKDESGLQLGQRAASPALDESAVPVETTPYNLLPERDDDGEAPE